MTTRVFLLFLIPCAFAFVAEQCHLGRNHRIFSRKGPSTHLHLIPLKQFDDSISFFSEADDYRCCIDEKGYFLSSMEPSAPYQLGLVEEEELPDLCKFVVTVFGAEAIQLSSNMNNFERMLLNPAAEFLNGYSGMVAFAEVYSGTKQRLEGRFSKVNIGAPELNGLPSRAEKIKTVERDSLVLVVARPTSDGNDHNTFRSMEVIASIELRLQPCDAKIPFSIPWLDRVERRVGSVLGLGSVDDNGNTNDLQPYLCNLCVDETFRGQKIGRGLVRCVENIARTSWGYNRMYLHVDEQNLAALNLYKNEGYSDVGHRWNPFWSGGASEIGYYVKSLS